MSIVIWSGPGGQWDHRNAAYRKYLALAFAVMGRSECDFVDLAIVGNGVEFRLRREVVSGSTYAVQCGRREIW